MVSASFVAQSQPWVVRVWFAGVGQVGLAPVTDVEQVAEHRDARALPAFPQQRGYRHAQILPQQIEQRGFDRGDGMDGDAHIEGLKATPGRVAIAKALLHGLQNLAVSTDGAADDRGARIFENLADPGAARNLAGAGMPGIVGQQHDIAGEVRRVGAAQVQQHAVAAGNRNHTHAGYTRRGRNSLWLDTTEVFQIRPASPIVKYCRRSGHGPCSGQVEQRCRPLLVPEQQTGGFRLEWPAEQESLHEFASYLAQLAYLLFRLHAFRNRFQPQLPGQNRHRTDGGKIGSRTVETLNE